MIAHFNPDQSASDEKIGVEIFGILAITFGLLLLGSQFPHYRWLHALPPMAFVYPAVLVIFFRKLEPSRYGLSPKKFDPKEIWLFVKISLSTLLPFVLGYHVYNIYYRGWALHVDIPYGLVTQKVLFYFFFQILAVALPEEFFFRGYLQERMGQWPGLKSLPWGALLLSNAFFALSHLLGTLEVTRLLTYFPGLVFGFLWLRTKNLFYPVVYHAICNTVLYGLGAFYVRG